MIGHDGLLKVFSFTHQTRGFGHAQEIYSQTTLSSDRLVPITIVAGYIPQCQRLYCRDFRPTLAHC